MGILCELVRTALEYIQSLILAQYTRDTLLGLVTTFLYSGRILLRILYRIWTPSSPGAMALAFVRKRTSRSHSRSLVLLCASPIRVMVGGHQVDLGHKCNHLEFYLGHHIYGLQLGGWKHLHIFHGAVHSQLRLYY